MKDATTEPATTATPLDDAVTAAAAAGQVIRIPYLPKGEVKVTAWRNGRPAEVKSVVLKGDETVLQAPLEAYQASGAKPYGDENHDGKVRTYEARRFVWDEGFGIVLEAELTAAGAAALAGGNLPYHSPAWRVNRTTGRPTGLTGRNVGGFVPEHAFEMIDKIAARNAADAAGGDDPGHTNQTNNPNDMKTDAILAALAGAGILSPTEAATDAAPQLVTDRLAARVPKTQLDAVEARATKAEAALKTVAESAADDAIAAAVARGGIAPKDDTAKKEWKALLTSADEDVVKASRARLATLGTTAAGNRALAPVVKLASGEREAAEEEADVKANAAAAGIRARALELQRKEGISFSAAWGRAAAEAGA